MKVDIYLFHQLFKNKIKGVIKMKKIIKNIVEKMVVITLPIFLVVVAILNYELGSLMAEINGTYSQVSEISKNEFFTELFQP